MPGKNAFLVLCVISLLGCSDRLEEREQYRYIVGGSSMSLMIATLHADELVVSKINSETAGDRDRERITGLLEALKRHKNRFEKMLEQTYDREDLRRRDQKVMPLIQEMISATDSLNNYMDNKSEKELHQYFVHRDRFLELADKVKEEYENNSQ